MLELLHMLTNASQKCDLHCNLTLLIIRTSTLMGDQRELITKQE